MTKDLAGLASPRWRALWVSLFALIVPQPSCIPEFCELKILSDQSLLMEGETPPTPLTGTSTLMGPE